MDNPAANIGYVLMSLASLVGLAVGVRSLFRGEGSNGSRKDVTRREFEELKTLTRETLEGLKQGMSELNLALVEIRAAIKGYIEA